MFSPCINPQKAGPFANEKGQIISACSELRRRMIFQGIDIL